MRAGKNDEALRCYDEAIRLDLSDAMKWVDKGRVLLKLYRFEESIKCLNEALKMDSNNFHAWYEKGAASENLGFLDEAKKCFDSANKLKPGYVWAREHLRVKN